MVDSGIAPTGNQATWSAVAIDQIANDKVDVACPEHGGVAATAPELAICSRVMTLLPQADTAA